MISSGAFPLEGCEAGFSGTLFELPFRPGIFTGCSRLKMVEVVNGMRLRLTTDVEFQGYVDFSHLTHV